MPRLCDCLDYDVEYVVVLVGIDGDVGSTVSVCRQCALDLFDLDLIPAVFRKILLAETHPTRPH